jgi:hypothetical protein
LIQWSIIDPLVLAFAWYSTFLGQVWKQVTRAVRKFLRPGLMRMVTTFVFTFFFTQSSCDREGNVDNDISHDQEDEHDIGIYTRERIIGTVAIKILFKYGFYVLVSFKCTMLISLTPPPTIFPPTATSKKLHQWQNNFSRFPLEKHFSQMPILCSPIPSSA